MAVLWLKIVILAFLSLQIAIITVDAAQTFYMVNDDGTCSSSTLSGIPSGRIKSNNGSTYPKGVNCEMTWNSTTGTKTLVLITPNLADPENGTCVDVIEIYDPENETDTKHTLCGSNATKEVMEFGTAVIKFTFVTHSNSSFSGQGFTIEVTSFTDPSGGNCSASEFLCDNRCFESSLECDGVQNCVDNSDESSCLAGNTSTEATTSSTNSTDQPTVGSTDQSTVGSSTVGLSTTTSSAVQSTTSSQTSPTNQILAVITSPTSVLGDKVVLVIIILASAIIVTLIITAIVYTVWFKNNSVGPDVEITTIEVKQAPTTSGSRPTPKNAPTKPKTTPNQPPRAKAAATEAEPTPPARKGPAKKVKNLKKDAW